jgi:hypothetical protein
MRSAVVFGDDRFEGCEVAPVVDLDVVVHGYIAARAQSLSCPGRCLTLVCR